MTFIDGSSILLGLLNNNGTAAEFAFAAKTTTSLTLTVAGVSSDTQNIGLAEMQIYGF